VKNTFTAEKQSNKKKIPKASLVGLKFHFLPEIVENTSSKEKRPHNNG